jgi:hypothetical protein
MELVCAVFGCGRPVDGLFTIGFGGKVIQIPICKSCKDEMEKNNTFQIEMQELC